VNEGSIIERKDKQKRMKELGQVFSDHKHGYMLAIMIAKLEEYLDIFYEQDFHDIAISAKSMDAALVIDAYTEISRAVRSPAAPGRDARRAQGDGHASAASRRWADCCSPAASATRSASRYANDPIYEVEDGLELLYSLGCASARAST
jgi:(E)-4-hydroxy-3-methylbut-2-enyl-diphosphate synthase